MLKKIHPHSIYTIGPKRTDDCDAGTIPNKFIPYKVKPMFFLLRFSG